MAIGTRLYVGNLSFNTSEAALRSLFEQAGRVTEVKIPTDRETGQPRGFAFVEMGSPADAQAAISSFNGTSLDGRSLKVDEATDRGGGGGGGGPRGRRAY